ncbi:MAG: 4Fe-4S binding protein [Myxococcales bacterium]|jgi:polyferredoxin
MPAPLHALHPIEPKPALRPPLDAPQSDGPTLQRLQAQPSGGSTWRNLPKTRWAVQLAFLGFILLVGAEFFLFHRQVMLDLPITGRRPPSVEGFLPISALLALKRFLLTGHWDYVHPAGLTILIAAIVGAFAARKAFCGWICPIGTLSRALAALGEHTLWRRRRAPTLVPRWLDLLLSVSKYLLLGFFVWVIGVQMDLRAITRFLHLPYNYAADAKMLRFFLDPSLTAVIVLVVLAALSVVIKSFWCRYLCPYGALLGFAALFSPQRVRRDAAACTDCRRCTRSCPAEIPVHRRRSIWSPECIGCMSCVAACPVKDCLTNGPIAKKTWSPWLVPAVGVGVLLLAWTMARLTGHWETRLPIDLLIDAYRSTGLMHP